MTRKYRVTIPKNLSMYYCSKNSIIVFLKGEKLKSLKIKAKVKIDSTKKVVYVTSQLFFRGSNSEKRKMKMLRTTYVALLKQFILDVSTSFYVKFDLVGVGYKVDLVQISNLELLHLKLGYSHDVYFKLPQNFKIFWLTSSKFFIKGNHHFDLTRIAAAIKSHKIPEPYKGKGILSTTDVRVLKNSKRV